MPGIAEYTMIVRPDDNGTFVAYLPAIPGCHAIGHTSEEAQAELRHVFDMIEDEYRQRGVAMPPDVPADALRAG
jgi:predicted RNase H-like HicB family nuclease